MQEEVEAMEDAFVKLNDSETTVILSTGIENWSRSGGLCSVERGSKYICLRRKGC